MRAISYEGKIYASIRACCKCLGCDYVKVIRYIRHFKRAKDNPCLALDWAQEKIRFVSSMEPKTDMYYHDLELTRERVVEYKAKVSEKYQEDVKSKANEFCK